MLLQFVTKEIVENISGPKFLITFIICTVLILTSIYSGYELYRAEMSSRETALAASRTAMENSGSFADLKNNGAKTIRQPDRLSIFAKGVDSAIGRAALVSDDANIPIRDSRYNLNPIFAVFGELDLAFIVKIILALFALLFSYNAISGEREMGTLKLVMSNRVGRASFIIGKAIGGLTTLLLTFLVPLIIGLLMLIIIFNVNFTPEEWTRLGLMTLVFCLYLAVFFMIGMLMSALSRSSVISFLLCLFVWVLSVAIVPKAAVEVADRINPAPSIDELEKERAAEQRDYWTKWKNRVETALNEALEEAKASGNLRNLNFRAIEQEETKKLKEEVRSEQEARIREYEREQLLLLRTSQVLSRLSPTSCATLASSRLAYTGAELRDRYLELLRRHQAEFLKYIDAEIEEESKRGGRRGGISVQVDPLRGATVGAPTSAIDVSEAPEFSMVKAPLSEIFVAILPDLTILALEFLVIFAACFVAFLRYDVR